MQCRSWRCYDLFYVFILPLVWQLSICCSPCRPLLNILSHAFCSCTDSALGKRGVGPWLRHVWAEGAHRGRSSFCSPHIREFDCQTQTYAELRGMRSDIKLSVSTHPSNSVSPRFYIHSDKHIQFVLFSSDSCLVCDRSVYSHLNPGENIGCFFAVLICGSCQVWHPSPSFQSSVTFWTLCKRTVTHVVVVCLVVECEFHVWTLRSTYAVLTSILIVLCEVFGNKEVAERRNILHLNCFSVIKIVIIQVVCIQSF